MCLFSVNELGNHVFRIDGNRLVCRYDNEQLWIDPLVPVWSVLPGYAFAWLPDSGTAAGRYYRWADCDSGCASGPDTGIC